MKQWLEEARRLIKISSVTSAGNEVLANHLVNLFHDKGLKARLQQVSHSHENVSKRQFNVIGVIGDPLVDRKTRKGLLLSAHLDTSSAGIAEHWTETGGDPAAAAIKDGKIYGLGAASAKLDFLCKLRALEKFREKKLKAPVYLVGTCGHELGMFGCNYLIKSVALNPQHVVVGEPSQLRLVQEHKSANLFRVRFDFQLVEKDARGFNRRIDLHSYGRTSSGAYPELGVNAISQAVDFLRQAMDQGFEFRFTRLSGGEFPGRVPDRSLIEFYLTSNQFEDFKRFFRETIKTQNLTRAFRVELGGVGETGVRFLPEELFTCLSDTMNVFSRYGERLKAVTDSSYDPPFSTVNAACLHQSPGGVEALFEIRALPGQAPVELEQEVQSGLREVFQKYPGLRVTASLERSLPAYHLPEGELGGACREALEQAGLEPVLEKSSVVTEAAAWSAAGFDAVAIGPGESKGNTKSPNEHNPLDQLEKAVAFYERLIERLCL